MDAVCFGDKGTGVYKTLYIPHLYKDYRKGCTMNDIVDRILTLAESEIQKSIADFTEAMKDFSKVKKFLRMRVLNREKNKEMLENIPHQDLLDLARIVQIQTMIDGKSCSVKVSRDMISGWGVEEDEVFRIAEENMDETTFEPIGNIIAQLISMEEANLPDIDQEELPCSMYVLTNQSGMYGAVNGFNESWLADAAAKLGGNLFIIPSSIHECIILRENPGVDAADIREMIYEINRTQVASEEVLSDNLYVYDAATKKIEIAA